MFPMDTDAASSHLKKSIIIDVLVPYKYALVGRRACSSPLARCQLSFDVSSGDIKGFLL